MKINNAEVETISLIIDGGGEMSIFYYNGDIQVWNRTIIFRCFFQTSSGGYIVFSKEGLFKVSTSSMYRKVLENALALDMCARKC